MGKNITVTGYYGVGSSAAMDLLKEYSCNGSIVKDKEGGYEHTTFYHPGGLFDLEDKLLLGNDMHRSDEALRTFQTEMMRLNNYNFGWYGSFQNLFGDQFQKNLDDFLNRIPSFDLKAHYYGQCRKVVFNPLKVPLQLAAKILLGRTIYKWGRQFIYQPKKAMMHVAFPSEEEFYEAAQDWIKKYLELYREPGKDNILFDRLLLCQNLYRVPKYFDEDFRVIRVRRDVRDLYILSNYLWKEMNAGTMYPYGLDNFIDFWKRLHQNEKEVKDERILDIYFEDLIYNYEETVQKIEKHCGLLPEQHDRVRELFQPDKSIKNTQVFKLQPEWKEEIQKLEELFPEYLYDFPYDNETEVSQMFDDSTTQRKLGVIDKWRKR